MAVWHYTYTRVSCWSDLGRLAESKVCSKRITAINQVLWLDPGSKRQPYSKNFRHRLELLAESRNANSVCSFTFFVFGVWVVDSGSITVMITFASFFWVVKFFCFSLELKSLRHHSDCPINDICRAVMRQCYTEHCLSISFSMSSIGGYLYCNSCSCDFYDHQRCLSAHSWGTKMVRLQGNSSTISENEWYLDVLSM